MALPMPGRPRLTCVPPARTRALPGTRHTIHRTLTFFQARPLPGLSLQQTAEAIRDHILQTVGVPVTVGLARTRTLASLVSDTAKPFGAWRYWMPTRSERCSPATT